MSYKKVDPPFGYFGSKNNLALSLCRNLPPHNCWIEAFCGSAALTLAKPPSQIEIINDIDGEIVNLFKQLRDNSKELYRVIEYTPYAAQELINARMANHSDSDLERARKFLVQSMMAVNGIFGKERGGFSVSHSYSRNNREARVNRWNNLPQRLEKVVERLKNVRIENQNALNILSKYINRPATLIYLDPPYLGNRTNGYNKDANDVTFHKELLDLINSAKCMIFISSYNNDLYNSNLSNKTGWKKEEHVAFTKNTKGNTYPRTEAVWMNKHYSDARRTGNIPIDLTKKEERYGKINPER